MMNEGLDKILSCIAADAEAALAEMKAAHEKELAEIEADTGERIRKIKEAAEKTAAAETENARARAAAKAETETRGILASAKNELARRTFAAAAESFVTMDESRYLSLMAPLLRDAAAELAGKKTTLTVAKGHRVSAKALTEAAGITVDKVEEGDIRAGFLLFSDEISIDCNPEKLMMAHYEELAPAITATLFSAGE